MNWGIQPEKAATNVFKVIVIKKKYIKEIIKNTGKAKWQFRGMTNLMLSFKAAADQ